MSSVGRPPELDGNGEIVQKSLVNVTIPSKLAQFLKEKGINRSKLFTDVVTKLFNDEICKRCYSDHIEENITRYQCRSCKHILKYKNCENCNNLYDVHYNKFAQPEDKAFLKGCYDCIPPEERA